MCSTLRAGFTGGVLVVARRAACASPAGALLEPLASARKCDMSELLALVCLDDSKLPRDCVYAGVTAAQAWQTPGVVRLLRVVVHDAIGWPECARDLAHNLGMLVRRAVGGGERAGSKQ